MNAAEGVGLSVLNRTLSSPVGQQLDPVAGCCTVSPPSVPGADPFLAERLVQMVVVCVLSLTVVFGVFFLGCNLLIKSESLMNLLTEERRASKEAELMSPA